MGGTRIEIKKGSGIGMDGTTEIRKSDNSPIITLLVPSGGLNFYNVPDSPVYINEHEWKIKSTESLSVDIVNSKSDPVPTTMLNNQIVVSDTTFNIYNSNGDLINTVVVPVGETGRYTENTP